MKTTFCVEAPIVEDDELCELDLSIVPRIGEQVFFSEDDHEYRVIEVKHFYGEVCGPYVYVSLLKEGGK